MIIKPRYLIGFTGHRSGYEETLIRPVLARIFQDLKSHAASAGGEIEVYTGIAEGGDTLCVEVARELGSAVHLLLPLEEAEFAKDFSMPQAWERSRIQIENARQRPGRHSVQVVQGEASRPECYFNLGMRMLGAVDFLIALWDGQVERGLGGTAQVVDMARKTGIPVMTIDAQTGQTTLHGNLDMAFQRDAIVDELNKIAKAAGPEDAASVVSAATLQKALDARAMKEAARVRPSMVKIILLNGIAAILAAVLTFSFDAVSDTGWKNWHWIINAVNLLLVCMALAMTLRLRRNHQRDRWIRCRLACELVRGLRASIPMVDPRHPAIARHDLTWRRFALSAGLLILEELPSEDLARQRDRYVEMRLGDEHPDSQLHHYKTMQPTSLHWWNFTGKLSLWSSSLAPVFVFMAFASQLAEACKLPITKVTEKNFWFWLMLVFLPIALPLLAGIAGSLRHVLDAGRRKDRFPGMVTRLTLIKNALMGLKTPSTVRTEVERCEEYLLDELLEWQLAMKTQGAKTLRHGH